MENELKDIKNYINHNGVSQYTTKEVLDMINDKSIDSTQQRGIRRSLIFDDHIDLGRLVEDHEWYIDNLKATPKTTQKEAPKATRKEAPKVTPKVAPKVALKPQKTRKINLEKSMMVKSKDGWIINPKTSRLIKINGPTYKKLYPTSKPIKVVEATKPIPRRIKQKIEKVLNRWLKNMKKTSFFHP